MLLDFPNFYTNYEALASELQELIAEWGELTNIHCPYRVPDHLDEL